MKYILPSSAEDTQFNPFECEKKVRLPIAYNQLECLYYDHTLTVKPNNNVIKQIGALCSCSVRSGSLWASFDLDGSKCLPVCM